jgi:hypothetical protein
MQSHALHLADLEPHIREFYCRSLRVLQQAQIPFLIGGSYAFERYTGIARATKDLDLFLHPRDVQRCFDVFAAAGYETELSVPHWLGKAFCGDNFVDLIFGSANGCAPVDDVWFEHAVTDEVLGITVQVCPVEETIWSKAYVMARDRFDDADIAHLLLACGQDLNWSRLLSRFGDHWRVLFSHLVLFGFIYPSERSRVPEWVMSHLIQQLQQETQAAPNLESPNAEKVCQGTLLAPLQYQPDVKEWGYQDARLRPPSNLSQADIEQWTEHLTQEKEA